MTPQETMRALVDKANKQEKWPTGGDGRMTSEVINTSAIAKNQAIDRTKKGGIINAPKIPPLLPFGERLSNTAYRTGELIPIQENLPAVNAAGRWMKNNPVVNSIAGGVAQAMSTVGSSEFKPIDALAAGVDFIPIAEGAIKGAQLAAPAVSSRIEPATVKLVNWWKQLPGGKRSVVEALSNVVTPNPFVQ